ncbi:arrestin domain-containing protein 17-like [Ctenocephalides felis]|uniref:arrestin domain-containing protein 17-like n=1 Tax=Ctenocephalides felis TaxID=7515 RepID=UPI000E6E5B42|nr:arrestin domain-containing protein 17-like [Ctenocephalides felis]
MGTFKCEIQFDDNPQSIFYAGQSLNGKVVLTLTKPKTMKDMLLRIVGKASCSCSGKENYTDGDKQRTRTTKFSAEETYFESVTHLLGRNKGAKTTLPAGKHSYNFATILPPNMPCSFEGKHGYVRYTAKVTLLRPWKFDQHCKQAFTVISHKDLNLEPSYRWPLQVENTQYFCCGLSGPLNLSVRIPTRAYVPGQEVDLEIEVANRSRIKVQNLRCSLYQLIQYHFQTPHKRTKEVKVLLSESIAPGVKRNTSANLSHSVKLPPMPPTDLPYCNIIDIKYQIEVLARVNRLYDNLDITLPIVIGTIPLIAMNPITAPASPPNLNVTPGPSAPLLQEYLPTYEESFHHTKSIIENENPKQTLGFEGFTPKYPVYQHIENSNTVGT